MKDFKSEYQSAVQDMDMLGMKEIHIDAMSVLDERRHKRQMMKRLQRGTATAFSAVCVIFLCGFGTVKAAEYIGNVIKVNEWGFESGDAATMAGNGGGSGQAYVLGEEITLAMERASSNGGDAMGVQAAGEATERLEGQEAQAGEAGNGLAAQSLEEAGKGQPMERAAGADANQPALASEAAKGPMAEAKKSQTSGMEAGVVDMSADREGIGEVEEIPVKNYASWEDFEKNEDIIFPQPSINIGDAITSTDVTVCGDWAMVRYDVDGKVLWMERTDYADTQGHASSKVFPGGVCNERSYTTPQGYTYTLIDSVQGADEGMPQIHAAVTVGSYEAFIDFMGYTEEEAKGIMDSIDLSVYE